MPLRRDLASYVIWLRHDLRIGLLSGKIRSDLVSSLTNQTYFADEIVLAFREKTENGFYVIGENDSTRVILLKKIINAMKNLEQALLAIEHIDISSSRSDGALAIDVARLAYRAVLQASKAIQLISQTDEHIQHLLFRHFEVLIPKALELHEHLRELSPSSQVSHATLLGKGVAKILQVLPRQVADKQQHRRFLTELVVDLPRHFEQIQKSINFSAVSLAKGISAAQTYQKQVAIRVEKATKALERFLDNPDIWFGRAYYRLFKILKPLLASTSDIINTAHPLTGQAYLELVSILNELRHHYIPDIIIELQRMEEDFGLRAGYLVRPIMHQLNSHYQQLAHYVNTIKTYSDQVREHSMAQLKRHRVQMLLWYSGDRNKLALESIDSIPSLDVLTDEGFVRRVQMVVDTRALNAHKVMRDIQATKEAALRFYKRLEGFYSVLYDGYMARLDVVERLALAHEFKQFEGIMARVSPYVYKLIVRTLSVSLEERLDVIRHLGLSTEQYRRLADHLSQSFDSAEQYIDSLDTLSKEEKEHCLSAILVTDSERMVLANELAITTQLIKNKTSIAGRVAWLAKSGLGLVGQTVSVVGQLMLPSVNEFKDVLAVKRQLLTELNQQLADADASLKAAKASSEQFSLETDKYHQQSHYKKPLQLLDEPYEPIAWLPSDSRTSDEYHCDYLLLQRQLSRLDKSLDDVGAFFLRLSELASEHGGDFVVSKLPEAEKNALIKQYQLFQSHMFSLSIDKLFVSAFKKGEQVKLVSLLQRQMIILSRLKDARHETVTNIRSCLHQMRLQKAKELQRQPLGTAVIAPRQTLLGRLAELQLSTKLEEFLSNRMLPVIYQFLSDKLTSELGEDGLMPPHHQFHHDNAYVSFYKRLTQSIYIIEKSMRQLEQLADYEDETQSLSKVKNLVYPLTSALFELLNVMSHFDRAMSTPGMSSLRGELQVLIEPLKDMPIIGSQLKLMIHLHSDEPQEQASFFQQWQVEQALVDTFYQGQYSDERDDGDLDVEADVERPKDLTLTDVTMKEKLLQLPDKLIVTLASAIEMKPEDRAEIRYEMKRNMVAFVAALDNFSFKAAQIQDIMKIVNQLQAVLTNIGVTSRKTVLKQIKEIRLSMSSSLVKLADDAEFDLGLKPGSLSTSLLKSFDDFFSPLICCVTGFSDIDRHAFMFDRSLDNARMENERARYRAVLNDTFADEVANLINDSLERINELQTVLADTELQLAYLNALASTRNGTVGELSRGDKERFHTLLGKPKPNREALLSSVEDVKRQFIHVYERLQPHLSQIDFSFDNKYFLRELQTTADFKSQMTRILKLEPELKAIVRAKAKTKLLQLSLIDERIQYLRQSMLAKQIQGRQEFIKLKEDVFERVLLDVVVRYLPKTTGEFAPLLVQIARKKILLPKSDILSSISHPGNMERLIRARIEEHVDGSALADLHLAKAIRRFEALSLRYEWVKKELHYYKMSFRDDPIGVMVISRLSELQQQLVALSQHSLSFADLEQVEADVEYAYRHSKACLDMISLNQLINDMATRLIDKSAKGKPEKNTEQRLLILSQMRALLAEAKTLSDLPAAVDALRTFILQGENLETLKTHAGGTFSKLFSRFDDKLAEITGQTLPRETQRSLLIDGLTKLSDIFHRRTKPEPTVEEPPPQVKKQS